MYVCMYIYVYGSRNAVCCRGERELVVRKENLYRKIFRICAVLFENFNDKCKNVKT